ncbi:MAG: PilZ domain-containing protein [Shinella sp.]|nr:PilZ domain-containing protein [Shinella sp.]
MVERRRQRRVECLEIVPIHRDGKPLGATILFNYNSMGACFQIPMSFELGNRFDAKIPQLGQVHCRVVWRSESRVGVTFK